MGFAITKREKELKEEVIRKYKLLRDGREEKSGV